MLAGLGPWDRERSARSEGVQEVVLSVHGGGTVQGFGRLDSLGPELLASFRSFRYCFEESPIPAAAGMILGALPGSSEWFILLALAMHVFIFFFGMGPFRWNVMTMSAAPD